jgi:hypothetical protein
MPTGRLLQVDNEVPFGNMIYWWLRFAQGQTLDSLINRSRPYDSAYLAWEMVRKRRNPFFAHGTGFEGYLVGVCQSPDEALEQVLQISQEMLVSAMRLHRSDPRFRSKLFRVLVGESVDARAIAEWSAQLGAALGRLRCNLRRSRQADSFHAETYRTVDALPSIRYCETDACVRQTYLLDGHGGLPPKRHIDDSALHPDDQEAWLVAQSIGKFGHPLVRAFVNLCLE